MSELTVNNLVENFKHFLDDFIILDDFEKDDVFSKMTVPEVNKVIVLAKHLEDFKKRVSWK